MPKLAANFSMMFQEHPMLERFGVAAGLGFTGAEIQNPYEQSSDAIAQAYHDSGLAPVLFNIPTAVGAIPGKESEFEAGVSQALAYCHTSGCGQVHCLAGVTDDPKAEATFVSNLQRVAPVAQASNVRLLIEPLNTRDNPGYFLSGTTQAKRIIELVAADNVFLQYDCYHMQVMEGFLTETIKANLDIISHIQIAGVPGRHEPGETQEINYSYVLERLEEIGYDRWVACEYRPLLETIDGLTWASRYGIAVTPKSNPS